MRRQLPLSNSRDEAKIGVLRAGLLTCDCLAHHTISHLPNPVQQHPSRTTIIFVVVENALLDRRIASPGPAIIPFNGGRSRWVEIAPFEAEIFRQRLDRVVARRPLRAFSSRRR
jgi:hypothetical protein